jgi:hypothetical protein
MANETTLPSESMFSNAENVEISENDVYNDSEQGA